MIPSALLKLPIYCIFWRSLTYWLSGATRTAIIPGIDNIRILKQPCCNVLGCSPLSRLKHSHMFAHHWLLLRSAISSHPVRFLVRVLQALIDTVTSLHDLFFLGYLITHSICCNNLELGIVFYLEIRRFPLILWEIIGWNLVLCNLFHSFGLIII